MNSEQEQISQFDGLGLHLGNLSLLSNARSRSISPENPNGDESGGGRALPRTNDDGIPQGPARELGVGYKVRPCQSLKSGSEMEVAAIDGPGAIQSLWLTATGYHRHLIFRIYWDGQERPAVECPLSDFFASPWLGGEPYEFAQLSSLAVCVNPGSAYSCFWQMPFRKHARVTIENRSNSDVVLYWQVNYTLTQIPENAAYFHAQFRQSSPVSETAIHTVLSGASGRGHYVGTSMGWQANHNGWWGEGELKFYLDDDCDPRLSGGRDVAGSAGYPTICTTGTEDYFLGSYNFENQSTRQYQEFSGPYAGMPHVVRPDGLYSANQRFALYRWHLVDPIRFDERLKVTIQSLGWHRRGTYQKRRDHISSVAYWYQTLPSPPVPELPSLDELETV